MENTFLLTKFDELRSSFLLTKFNELHSSRIETINSSINYLKNEIVEEEENYRIVSSNIFEIENNLNKVGLTISNVYYEGKRLSVEAVKLNNKFKFIKSKPSTSYNKETGVKVMRLNEKLKENISSLSFVGVNPYSLEYDTKDELEGKKVLITFYF